MEVVEPIEVAVTSDVPAIPGEATLDVTPAVPHVARDGNPWRMYVSPDYFAAKYAGQSTEALESARAELAHKFPELMGEASKAYLDTGHGDLAVVPRKALTDNTPMPPGEKAFGLIVSRRTQVLSDGEALTQTVRLPWDEHSALYDKLDEKTWLAGEIKRRTREAQSSATPESSSQGK